MVRVIIQMDRHMHNQTDGGTQGKEKAIAICPLPHSEGAQGTIQKTLLGRWRLL